MRRLVLGLVVVGVLVGGTVVPAAADPTPNDHNCAGVIDSTFAGPGYGQAVAGVAQLFPSAIPTLFDLANCGGNGNGP